MLDELEPRHLDEWREVAKATPFGFEIQNTMLGALRSTIAATVPTTKPTAYRVSDYMLKTRLDTDQNPEDMIAILKAASL